MTPLFNSYVICKDFLDTSYSEEFDVIISNSVFYWFFKMEERAFYELVKFLVEIIKWRPISFTIKLQPSL